jgi:tetratricopeptide (TPR) repeat protein
MESANETIEGLLNIGEASIALHRINEAILAGNESDKMHINLARAMVQLGKAESGENILISIVGKEEPRSDAYVDASLLLGKLYLQTKKFSSAEQQFSNVLEVNPENPVALAGIGKLLMARGRSGDIERALEMLAAAVSLSPTDEKTIFDYAVSLLYNKQEDGAKIAFEKAGDINPTLDRNIIGKMYFHFKLYDWGVAEIERATELAAASNRPPDSEALLLLAEQYELRNRREEAIEVYEYVLKFEPRNAGAHAFLGLLLLGTGARNYAAMNACGINQQQV